MEKDKPAIELQRTQFTDTVSLVGDTFRIDSPDLKFYAGPDVEGKYSFYGFHYNPAVGKHTGYYIVLEKNELELFKHFLNGLLQHVQHGESKILFTGLTFGESKDGN